MNCLKTSLYIENKDAAPFWGPSIAQSGREHSREKWDAQNEQYGHCCEPPLAAFV